MTRRLFHISDAIWAELGRVADELTEEQAVPYTRAMLLREGAELVVAKYSAKGEEPAAPLFDVEG